jgi:acyl-CoA thioesterase-2
VLAYASDMLLLDTSLYPHGRSLFDRDLQVASLDHALWFHRPFRRTNGCSTRRTARRPPAPAASTGQHLTRDGVHVASVAQEG